MDIKIERLDFLLYFLIVFFLLETVGEKAFFVISWSDTYLLAWRVFLYGGVAISLCNYRYENGIVKSVLKYFAYLCTFNSALKICMNIVALSTVGVNDFFYSFLLAVFLLLIGVALLAKNFGINAAKEFLLTAVPSALLVSIYFIDYVLLPATPPSNF